ncbi:MAG: spore protease YyaC [Dethiobacteraceae bacterium]|jgi:putative sporulation protein YyaC|nr:spore protease YyaC [Bacillota bacterium]
MSTYPPDSRQKQQHAYRIWQTDLFPAQKIKVVLQKLLAASFCPGQQQLVILCIGTDRSTGDALGPLIGTQLTKKPIQDAAIYGTLAEPVHAVNLADTITAIYHRFPRPYIIAIDACLGKPESVGAVDIGLGPLRPGAGVSKTLPAVGDIYISGIVNTAGFLEYYILQNTRLNIVFNLAESIAQGILLLLQDLPTSAAVATKEAAH